MQKLNLILVFLLVLVLNSNVIADDALTLDSGTLDSEQESADSMTWPMLPGENLNDVARLFYPKSKAMQQRFIFKTQRLSAEFKSRRSLRNADFAGDSYAQIAFK
jgi:hypothetical protein